MLRQLIATDNFNRANSASLGANWSNGPTSTGSGSALKILSNAAYNVGTSDCDAFWSGSGTFTNDHYSKVRINTRETSFFSGVVVRGSATDQVMGQYQADNGQFQIVWYNGATYTQIGGTLLGTINVGDILALEAIGTTFNLYLNDVLLITGTNGSAPSTGKPGILASGATDSTDSVDDWEGGSIISPLTENITDNFDDNKINLVKWTPNIIMFPIIERNTRLEIICTAGNIGDSFLQSNSNFNFTNSSLFMRLFDGGNVNLASYRGYIYLKIDGNNYLFWKLNSGSAKTISAGYLRTVDAGNEQVVFSVAYDINVHRWVRFRESGGTVFWDYATAYIPKSSDWINAGSVADPITITALNITLEAFTSSNEATTTIFKVDNLNCIPPIPLPTFEHIQNS